MKPDLALLLAFLLCILLLEMCILFSSLVGSFFLFSFHLVSGSRAAVVLVGNKTDLHMER